MTFEPTDLTTSPDTAARFKVPGEGWIPILKHSCDFDAKVFLEVSLNLIKNPNINSTHLFRADILYDSLNGEYTNTECSPEELQRLLRDQTVEDGGCPGFELKRTIIRVMIPRNPQLDKPIAQTCHILCSVNSRDQQQTLVVYVPHASHLDALPWYHPAVQSVAHLHTWHAQSSHLNASSGPAVCSKFEAAQGHVSIHYRLFPAQGFPLSPRLIRTAHHLLLTLYKHGQGSLVGYQKRVHHDQLISQQRVQDTYTELKRKHAKRLCDSWVEQTEPSKHVFEDLGIAAFLIELWKDMYCSPANVDASGPASGSRDLPPFPGFVDIGCGNGVLTEVLLLSGYHGWGFDARRRKTWSILSQITQKSLHELMIIPQPLFELDSPPHRANGGILSHMFSTSFPFSGSLRSERKSIPWHNGMFAPGTFIISNHADELTPWTPLLASLSCSSFLAIPCCSHNLSGLRFRAPSVFNSLSADMHAPAFFAQNVKKSKSIAISVASHLEEDIADSYQNKVLYDEHPLSLESKTTKQPETGDLKAISATARAKQPSAYSSLCDWVSHLTSEVGYVAEREILRTPSTRNVGIVGRTLVNEELEYESRRLRVAEIIRKEGADGNVWVERCRGLMKENAHGHDGILARS
ncbi:tRNA(Ser) Um(44) 2'-O-methyltransferase [Lignoscripta atroalba]|nr:tRNA(Ser) Um(44) 2'-O-methyltransferase [Lignoscripta atroalba]